MSLKRVDYHEIEDARLIQLVSEKDSLAFQELFERYWQKLFDRAFPFLEDEDEANDCVQEVFISLWKNNGNIRIANISNYLFQSVRFRAFRALHNQKIRLALQKRLSMATSLLLYSDALEFKELQGALFRMIQSLPEDQRLIFLLHREERLTLREISQRLNIPLKTVEKKMSLSIRMLRKQADALGVPG